MRFLVIILSLLCFTSFSQPKNNRGRLFGIGAQLFEPAGLNIQTFRGAFNNNNSSLSTRGVLELGIGKENILGLAADKKYAGGNWLKGGLRFDLNYWYPLITTHAPFVFQTYVGGGLQTGTRLFNTSEGSQSTIATGANLMVRIEFVTHGIDLGRAVWFFSVYGDIKYHTDFTESFDYLSPVVGVRLRKGR